MSHSFLQLFLLMAVSAEFAHLDYFTLQLNLGVRLVFNSTFGRLLLIILHLILVLLTENITVGIILTVHIFDESGTTLAQASSVVFLTLMVHAAIIGDFTKRHSDGRVEPQARYIMLAVEDGGLGSEQAIASVHVAEDAVGVPLRHLILK